MVEKTWIPLEAFSTSLGIPSEEVVLRFVDLGLLDGRSIPTKEAKVEGYAKQVGLWPWKKTTLWNVSLLSTLLRDDRLIERKKTEYIQIGTQVLLQSLFLLQCGRDQEALDLETRFWSSLPSLLRAQIQSELRGYFRKAGGQLYASSLESSVLESSRRADILEVTPFRREGIREFLSELNQYSKPLSLITLCLNKSFVLSINAIGSEKLGLTQADLELLQTYLRYGTAVIIHTIRDDSYREVRGFRIGTGLNGFFYKQMDKELLFSEFSTMSAILSPRPGEELVFPTEARISPK